MKKLLFILTLFLTAVFSSHAQRLTTVGVLPFERPAGISEADAAEAARLLIDELSSWGTLAILPEDQAERAEYIIRGRIARQNNLIVLSAETVQARTGRVLNASREEAAALHTIDIFSFSAQVAENIPFPNYLIGRWMSVIPTSYGPLTAILEFRANRTIVVERYDTWEHNGTNSLRYQAIGTGTYTYAGYLRRNVTIGGRTIQADATASISLTLEDALSEFTNINAGGLRILFDDDRNSFTFTNGSLPAGNNFSGHQVHPTQRIAYTQFTRLPDQPPPVRSRTASGASLWDIEIGAAPIWYHYMGDLALGQPYLMAESVVVATRGGSVQSYFRTGTPLWDFDSRIPITPYIARSMEGVTYLSDQSGYFRAVNRVGRELWRTNEGRAISFPPVVGWDGRIFIPLGQRLACRTAAGHPLWNIDLGSPMAVQPMLDRGGSLITVLENRDFVRIGPFSAVERLRLDQMPSLVVPLKTNNQNSYILLYPGGEAEILHYNEGNARGSRLSRQRFPSLPGPPAAASSATLSAEMRDVFAVTLRDGRVMLINISGRVLWTGYSHETTAERGSGNLQQARASMVFDERGIYSITTRGATGFDFDGRRRFLLRFTEASSIPAFSDEGLLYVCGTNRVLYVYGLDSRPRTVLRNRFFGPEPEGTYGMGNPPPSPWSLDPFRFNINQQDMMYNRILAAIDSGQLGEREPIYVAYLMEMIGFFLNDPHFSRVRPAVNPIRHIEFIDLLGRVGSRETVPFLRTIFNRYHEPSVRSASAEAIARIGVDPDGSTFQSFHFFLAPNNPNRDPQLLLSATGAIVAISRYSGPPLSGEGLLLLRLFSNLTWAPRAIQNHIRGEIDAMFAEGLDRIIR